MFNLTRRLFSVQKPKVYFVLGGPGSGKGTQCELLQQKYANFVHLSAGDLLRSERDSGSQNGDLINTYIADGKIVPVEITCTLLEKAMTHKGFDNRFLIDGFPRSFDNVKGWNQQMGSKTLLEAVLWFDCDSEKLKERIMKRAETSGRNDDNLETLAKRLSQFKSEQMPIIMSYQEQGKVKRILADGSRKQIFE